MRRPESARAVVLAVEGGWATVMSPDGAFRRVRARPAWRVGDDVLAVEEVSGVRRAMPWLGSAGAAVAAAAVTFGVMSTLAANRTVLYVNIVGSHPATLAVNANGQVLDASADGKGALPVAIRRGEPLVTAVETLARAEAKTVAGVSEPGTVVISFYAPKGATPPAAVSRTVQMAASATGAMAVGTGAPLSRSPASSRQGAGASASTMQAAGDGRVPEETA